MRWPRIQFLLNGLAVGGELTAGAAAWAGLSDSRRARFIRQLLADLRRPVPPAPLTPRPANWDHDRLTFAWLGHATVLINFYGLKILTDPTFFDYIGINSWLGTFGPKRQVQCALKPRLLPEIDVVLLSHAHLDHLDLASLGQVRGRPQVITAVGTRELLQGLSVLTPRELRWGEAVTLKCGRGELRVEAFEVKHWGRRWPRGKERGYNGYVLEREGRRILFGGDTAFTESFARLKPRGPFEVALMPIGAYNPWIHSHCTPEEAVRMADSAGARHILPLHHATFKFSDEPMGEPLERILKVLDHELERISVQEIGGTFSCD